MQGAGLAQNCQGLYITAVAERLLGTKMQINSKVGHLQPFYLCLSRLGCSLGELQDVWPDKFCQA